MEAAESTLRPGYRLDRYELLCPIASGGMASVWLARLRGKRGFEKLFAIKTIKSELTDDPRFQEMFLDEARIASGIQHPNVAQILDLGEQENVLYIVMEWVDGESLAKIRRLAQTRGTPMPLGIALRVTADACAGLHAAHELRDIKGTPLGIVHRDVSPQNILVSSAGTVKVIDFGVAKAKNRGAGETRSGVVKGKIRYMAPEQVQGKAIDRRVDVWAMGACLHLLVTGNLPFDGDDDIEVMRRLMGDEPPLRLTDKQAVVPAIEKVLQKSLARDPDARFPTAAAMHRALEAAMDDLGLSMTSEDVADFVHKHLADLATTRAEVVAKAMAEVDTGVDVTRASGKARAAKPVADDVAFAPTVMSQHQPMLRSARAVLEATEESKGTASTFTGDADGAPKRRGIWTGLTIVAAVAAGAWFVWPGAAKLRAQFAPTEPTQATTSVEPSAPPPPAVVSAPPTAPVDAPALPSASQTPVVAAAPSANVVPVASSAPPPPSASAHRPRLRWPKPSESSSATPMAPLPAPSAPPEEDDSNPYP